ncbi:ABC transporter permease [Ferrovibrio xuzhouensis]|uniref:ABC transporter permease n=1 Tax=Ferrovibrio xuzhouensis TaxID=1576914 RepID=A0ABV7VLP6_9PROT
MQPDPAVATTLAPMRRRPSLLRRTQEIWLPVVVIAVLVMLWEIACRVFAVPGYLLPSPSAIWAETWQMRKQVLVHGEATLITVLAGFLVSVAISLPLAVALTASRTIANAIYPVLILTQSIPKVALAPILVVLLGANELPRIVITFLIAFFPLVLSCAAGLLAVPPELMELGRACKASRWQELTRIRLPFAMPFVFSGLKAAIALAVVGAVVAEFVNADRGLGYMIISATAFFKVPLAWGALILLSIMGIVLFQVVVVIERILVPWSNGNEKA